MQKKIRLVVADDSPSVLKVLTDGISSDPQIEIVGVARDGIETIELVGKLKPDVVTLDVEMPHMSGIEALERIMVEQPTPVVMVSSLTGEGTSTTIRALELGAVDFVLKQGSRGGSAVRGLIDELLEKIHAAAGANVTGLAKSKTAADESTQEGEKQPDPTQARVVLIASSTGGPQALRMIIPALPGDLPAAVLVVQHLPAGFTARMAESLNDASALTVEEAKPSLQLEPGKVLIAPGGVHMRVSRGRRIRLSLEDRECGVRPSANPIMESLAQVYGASTLGVVLTGMGADGTRGAGLIKASGGAIVAEHESTCVVYGMPKSVAEAGYVDRVVPLPRMASEIARRCQLEEHAA
ncbi:MAG: chemotaxis response regulator protein-glutamate methylesterase [Chloroflexi bacterium]|nr:chemotaxis response regulator protein-glutamate methylesterase [Chloroflexota bacterium]MCI0855572.1 chemotaxis response regulator protein-glutamate methylesterase [Chloroflexota bacterium]MCI0889207.1 chemotaxis response regulator protein-glutamate methylesterase [Chloroflexota bacterium]